MGDSRRFDLFAKLATKYFPASYRIADVAGGVGYMRLALEELGYRNVETWGQRPRKIKGRQRYQYFHWQTNERYDALVAMHPDEATDHAILYAAKHRIPVLICPCCTKPNAVPFWGQYNFTNWIRHLTQLAEKNHMQVQQTVLKMSGRNLVLILMPV